MRPQLSRLFNAVHNSRLYPNLTGKRLSFCNLQRMPSYFKPTRTKG